MTIVPLSLYFKRLMDKTNYWNRQRKKLHDKRQDENKKYKKEINSALKR